MRNTDNNVGISIILPIYNEEENIRPLYQEIKEALKEEGRSYEIIAIDDGSNDDSATVLTELAGQDPSLKVIISRRNFGQTAAFDAGFRFSPGGIIVTMDADRQNDPADVPKLIAKLEEGFDLVTGWRKKRKDKFLHRRIPSLIANGLIRWVTRTRVHDLGCSLKVFRREITDELRLYSEMHRFLAPLAEGIGARVTELIVNHRPRVAGKSKYGIGRTFKVLLDLLTIWFMRRFTTKPIYVFGGAGLFFWFLGFLLSLVVLWQRFAFDAFIYRNPLFQVIILLILMGAQFLGMGLIAELQIRTYFESQQKPAYSIKRMMNYQEQPAGKTGKGRVA